MTRVFFDPYDKMSDDDFDEHIAHVVAQSRERSVAVSIRFPESLLAKIKKTAATIGMPYQSLIKGLLEEDITRLMASGARPGRRRVAAAAAKRTTGKRTTAAKRQSGKAAVPSAKRKPVGKIAAAAKRSPAKGATAQRRRPTPA